jgi:hypothetical protein
VLVAPLLSFLLKTDDNPEVLTAAFSTPSRWVTPLTGRRR